MSTTPFTEREIGEAIDRTAPAKRETLRKQIERLNELHDLCGDEKTYSVRLGVLSELNRLLGLYPAADMKAETENEGENAELRQIREFLRPLNLTKKEVPVLELVRLAVTRIQEPDRNHAGRQDQRKIPAAKTGRRETKPGKVARGAGHLSASARAKLDAP